jgi:type I restriction enzyme S subunit
MGSEWRETTVGEFAPFTYGKGLREAERNDEGSVPVFGSNGIIGHHDMPLVDSPAIIIGRKGTVGAVHFSAKPCWPIDTTFYVVDKDVEILRFKFYLLKSLQLDKMNADSAVPGLNRSAAHARRIRIPPLPEQRAIAHILGALDDQIETLRRMNETLEGIARALFKAWFVDFEPVRAKMSGRWRRGQSLPGLPAHLYALFPDTLVPSELGQIPQGWQIKSLDEIADFLNGLALQKYPPEGSEFLPVIKIRELRDGQPDNASDKASVNIPKEYVINDGDVIFSWSGSLLLQIWHGGKGALNQHLFKVTSSQYPKWFYYHWIDEHLPAFQRIAASKATTMGHIQRHHLSEAKVVAPPKAQLKVMSEIMQPLLNKRTENAIQSRTLAALRDALLPELISGRLRLADAERFLQARGL